jgi:hypothetical protein
MLAAAGAAIALACGACSFDSSSAAQQRHECRSATAGQTSRERVHAALGDPTTTRHETVGGRRRTVDIYLDGHVGFSFDTRTAVLVEKDCASAGR